MPIGEIRSANDSRPKEGMNSTKTILMVGSVQPLSACPKACRTLAESLSLSCRTDMESQQLKRFPEERKIDR